MAHLIIKADKCIGCGLCSSVCIRGAIKIENWKAVEDPDCEMGCFDCGHCMAVCPNDGIRLTRYEGQRDVSIPYGNKPVLGYDTFIRFLSERRSMRWMTKEPVTSAEFSKLFAAAHNSPSSNNSQSIRFVVVDKDLYGFEKHIASILEPLGEKLPRIKQYVEYMEDPTKHDYNPFLWMGKQVILAFSSLPADAYIAMTRIEMAASTLGLGGFYSRYIPMADQQDHAKLMEFFPEIPEGLHLNAVFVIGHPKIRFRRTVPRMDTVVHMR